MLMTTEDRQYHGEKFLLLYIYLITKCWKQLDLLVAKRQAWALLEVCPQDCMWPDHAFKLFKDVYELDFVSKAHQFLCNPWSKQHLHQQDSWKTKIWHMWESPQVHHSQLMASLKVDVQSPSNNGVNNLYCSLNWVSGRDVAYLQNSASLEID